MSTLDQWQYVQNPVHPNRGVVLTGVPENDARPHLNGRRIYTSTLISAGVHGESPIAVTASGRAYRFLDHASLLTSGGSLSR